jgi:hypothetical protein
LLLEEMTMRIGRGGGGQTIDRNILKIEKVDSEVQVTISTRVTSTGD